MSIASDPLGEYERAVRKWASSVNSPARNKLLRRSHEAFKAIRSTEGGRDLLKRLAMDPDDSVAAVAATDVLWFDQEFGTPILARIASQDSEAGLSATWTLRMLSDGKLDLDW